MGEPEARSWPPSTTRRRRSARSDGARSPARARPEPHRAEHLRARTTDVGDPPDRVVRRRIPRPARAFVSDGVFSRFQVQLELDAARKPTQCHGSDARLLNLTVVAVEDAPPLDVVQRAGYCRGARHRGACQRNGRPDPRGIGARVRRALRGDLVACPSGGRPEQAARLSSWTSVSIVRCAARRR